MIQRTCFGRSFFLFPQNQQPDKLLFGGVPPLSPSHQLVRISLLMTNARYRSLSGKLLFEELK
jgi:hypothetical protein